MYFLLWFNCERRWQQTKLSYWGQEFYCDWNQPSICCEILWNQTVWKCYAFFIKSGSKSSTLKSLKIQSIVWENITLHFWHIPAIVILSPNFYFIPLPPEISAAFYSLVSCGCCGRLCSNLCKQLCQARKPGDKAVSKYSQMKWNKWESKRFTLIIS